MVSLRGSEPPIRRRRLRGISLCRISVLGQSRLLPLPALQVCCPQSSRFLVANLDND